MDNNNLYHQNNNMNGNKESYQEYKWLFGRSK
jgi:hypothetical protein